jgi:hypothetical protein
LANSLQLEQFILEGDSTIVISYLNEPALSLDWHFELVIYETLSNFQVSSIWEARKINKNVNFYAHYAAYRAAVRVFLSYILFLALSVSTLERILLFFSHPCEGFLVCSCF